MRPFRPLGLVVAAGLLTGLLAPPAAAVEGWPAYDRPVSNGVVFEQDVPVTMSDGVVLRADIQRPDQPGQYPVILTQTPYSGGAGINDLTGQNQPSANYFSQRGYVTVSVDVRGTGGSQGAWESFGAREQQDGYELVEWAGTQPWSAGDVGLGGPSYMGINQLLTAAQQPPHLKTIAPIVAMADSYRDIFFPGGSVNSTFVAPWMLGIMGGSTPPPGYTFSGDQEDFAAGMTVMLDHLQSWMQYGPPLFDGALGGDSAYDNEEFWGLRSPIEVLDRVQVPTFVIGGWHDIFQRGEPLLYERLKGRVPTKLLMGPWTHGTAGSGLNEECRPNIEQMLLQWYDHHLKGLDTGVDQIPAVTSYRLGDGHFYAEQDWPNPRMSPTRYYLRGGRSLSTSGPGLAESPQAYLQQPFNGFCTGSTAYAAGGFFGDGLCQSGDNRYDEQIDQATYTTPPLTSDLRFDGPILASIWLTTTAQEAPLTVRVTDVAPDGSSTELSSGWLAASFRALDETKSRYVGGQLMQPWHPFTKASAQPVPLNTPIKLDLEILPTNAVIKVGHSLRVVVSPSDFPHTLPPPVQLVSSIPGVVQILTDPAHPSYVALPTLGTGCTAGVDADGGCRPLPVPNLTRG